MEGGDGCGVSVAASGSRRVNRPWTPEEDELLRRAVARHGPRKWPELSADIPGRCGKSCRRRWVEHLSPGLEHRAFTPEEDAVIVAAQAKHGNKWATIARMLPGRTDNSIKNRWNFALQQQCRAAAASANTAGCALPLRPATTAPVPLPHLLDLNKKSTAAEASIPFHRLEPEDDEGMGEGDDGSSEVSPPAPLTLTLSLSSGVHGTLASQSTLASAATLASQSTFASAATTAGSAMTMRTNLEQNPWLVPALRLIVSDEVQRKMQEMRQVTAPASRSSADAADGSAANGQD
ncbi:transcription factor MYB77 [Zea mays]|jgi:transcription factor MYB, plant|uniref:Putative MYB DNA-binding domain superfamily protein n=1 Tax=Zea mays TaxID=4577 RepID=A0A1D6M2P1_MAIZE|nr:transcription factor MYB77 [Zea mays]AQK85450.1 Putative MYB DNA-binding domain superfamily protein [Zea mays]|eukprot:XP_008649550.1 transcription factor CSA [Zea mays]